MIKARLLNAKYSPNLGDGLLAECLEYALMQCSGSRIVAESFDIAARTAYEPGNPRRNALLHALPLVPGPLRRIALRVPLKIALHRKWMPHYRTHLEDADALVIGGGNLFTDMDLNFPTKMASAVMLAKAAKLPIFVYGVGVSREWSQEGILLMAEAFRGATVPYVSVRDAASKCAFDALFADLVGRDAQVVRDPGLLASRYWSYPEHHDGTPVIGLNIMSAIAVRYHSKVDIGDIKLVQWYQALYRQLTSAGHRVSVFTNGSPEDVEFAKYFLRGLPDDIRPLERDLRPANPSQLTRIVSQCAVVVAFRMHALVAACSYGAGIIALEWDSKIGAFLESIGQGQSLVSPNETHPETVAAMATAMLATADRPRALDNPLVKEALENVAALATCLEATCG